MLKPQNKIKTVDELKTELLIQAANKIVFTNGCFDILHYGHFNLLLDAKALGDILIVAINSDRSVKSLKGESRPINDQYVRAFNMACIGCVDYVIIFDEDTPYKLLCDLQYYGLLLVDLLVKGGDYVVKDVVGNDIVTSIKIIPLIEGYSTSALIEKIKCI